MGVHATTVASPGAGRFRDSIWPDPSDLDQAPNNTKAGVRNAVAPQSPSTGFTTSAASGSGSNGGQLTYKGVDCAQLYCNVTSPGCQMRFGGWYNAHIKTSRTAIPTLNDDEAATRVYANLAIQGAIAAGGEMSFNMMIADSMGPVTGGATGWGISFPPADTAHVNLVCGATGPLGRQAFQIAVNDTTAWHSYEFRITSATPTTDAQLQVLIDGTLINIPAMFASWAAGTCLPPSQTRASRTGFQVGLSCNGLNANSLYVSTVRFMTAPTMAGLM